MIRRPLNSTVPPACCLHAMQALTLNILGLFVVNFASLKISRVVLSTRACAAALIFKNGEGIWFDISMLTNDLLTTSENPVFTTAVVSTTKAVFKQKTAIEAVVDIFYGGFVSMCILYGMGSDVFE